MKALYRRGQAYIELFDLDLAEWDYKKALELDPQNRFVPAEKPFFGNILLLFLILSET